MKSHQRKWLKPQIRSLGEACAFFIQHCPEFSEIFDDLVSGIASFDSAVLFQRFHHLRRAASARGP